MTFDEAIHSHASWKHRLLSLITGSSTERLDPRVVGRDDQCDLGRWVQEMARTPLGMDPTFRKLAETHARFHEAAGTIVTRVQRGEHLDYQKVLFEGRFADLSTEVIGHILVLRRTYQGRMPSAANYAAPLAR